MTVSDWKTKSNYDKDKSVKLLITYFPTKRTVFKLILSEVEITLIFLKNKI